MGKEPSESARARDQAQHEGNALHVYCRLLDRGLSPAEAMAAAREHERAEHPSLYEAERIIEGLRAAEEHEAGRLHGDADAR